MQPSTKRLETMRRSGVQGLKWLFSRRWNLAGGFPHICPIFTTDIFHHIHHITSLLFRHVINLVDFFEGVSESVIVMEFAEGWPHIILPHKVLLVFFSLIHFNLSMSPKLHVHDILKFTDYHVAQCTVCVNQHFNIFSGTDLFATLSAVHYELTEAKCRIIIAQVLLLHLIDLFSKTQ